MWIFFNDAFLSIVQDHNDPGTLLVRARKAGDIQRVFGKVKVSLTPENDYLFRAFIPREVVAEAMMQATLGIDYSNFKGSIPAKRRSYHDACFRVWNIMFGYQCAEDSPAARARVRQAARKPAA